MSQKRTEEAPLLPLDFSTNNRKQQRGVCLSASPGWKLWYTEQLTRGTKHKWGSEAAFTEEETDESVVETYTTYTECHTERDE